MIGIAKQNILLGAIERVKPVFDSLLKVGVIVPCLDPPVLTPVFQVNSKSS